MVWYFIGLDVEERESRIREEESRIREDSLEFGLNNWGQCCYFLGWGRLGGEIFLGGNQGFAISHVRFEVPVRPLRDGGQQVTYMSWSPWEGCG